MFKYETIVNANNTKDPVSWKFTNDRKMTITVRTNRNSDRTRSRRCDRRQSNRNSFKRKRSGNSYVRRRYFSSSKHNQPMDEVDGIYPMEICDVIMSKAPRSVPASFNMMPLGSQPLPTDRSISQRNYLIKNVKPDQKGQIFIQHSYEGKPVSDVFGAELWTFQGRRKDDIVYNIHLLVNVKPNEPAAKMKISNYDEIVLLNNMFVPDLTHEDVLNLFRKVKIDGVTRFKLIIRRIVSKKWEWIDSSAVLSPVQKHDNHPVVKKPECTTLPGNEYEKKSIQFFKIPGTQYYLAIKNESVVADVMTNTDDDKTKRICKILRFSTKSDGLVHFTAALCDETNTSYIVVGQGNQIQLDSKPMWFEVTYTGSDIQFKTKDMFLGFNFKTVKIEAVRSTYMFSEFPAEDGFDFSDRSVSIPSDKCTGSEKKIETMETDGESLFTHIEHVDQEEVTKEVSGGLKKYMVSRGVYSQCNVMSHWCKICWMCLKVLLDKLKLLSMITG